MLYYYLTLSYYTQLTGFGSRDDTHQYNNQLLYNTHNQGNTHTRRAKTDDSLSSEEVREREARFQHFLGRQQQSALRHAQHLKTVSTVSITNEV